MQVETYLKQGLLLDRRINYHIKELNELRADACNISAPAIGKEKVKSSPSGDAPFVRALMRVEELQEKINREIDVLVDLRNQIEEVINQVKEENLRMLLYYKYRQGISNEQISRMLNIGHTTLFRWHANAIKQITLPEDAIVTRIW